MSNPNESTPVIAPVITEAAEQASPNEYATGLDLISAEGVGVFTRDGRTGRCELKVQKDDETVQYTDIVCELERGPQGERLINPDTGKSIETVVKIAVRVDGNIIGGFVRENGHYEGKGWFSDLKGVGSGYYWIGFAPASKFKLKGSRSVRELIDREVTRRRGKEVMPDGGRTGSTIPF
jgi:hypothetical protein